MWHDAQPGVKIVPELVYSANTYTNLAVDIIQRHNQSQGLYLHMMYQNVHSPYTMPPGWEDHNYPKMWDNTYANMLHMLDEGVGNITAALKAQGMWDNTLLLFSADNGGIGKGNNHPLRGHKHDPWEGGTRATAFLSGGFLPDDLKGTASGDSLVHIADWYPTMIKLAGGDPSDDVEIEGELRSIDGVDVWPLLTGANKTQPRPMTPTTEVSIISLPFKLIVGAGQSNYYDKNGTQLPSTPNDLPCLSGAAPAPSGPGVDPIINGKCAVCNATLPCLFDIVNDPTETKNLATSHPDVVERLKEALSYKPYVTGKMSKDELKPYTQVDPNKHWKGFEGPCYIK